MATRRIFSLPSDSACLCYNAAMERDAAIATLKEHEAELKRLGVEHLFLFGSTARGEAREDFRR